MGDTERMKIILRYFYLIHRDERGTSAIEYAFIAALIAVVIIVAVTEIGQTVSGTFGDVDQAFKEAN